MIPTEVLAIIPARKGSKGIPGKNLVPLHGTPLIGHTLKCAKQVAGLEILVSTDSDDILSYSKLEFGIDTGYKRPNHLASDEAGMADVVLDVIEWWKQKRGAVPRYVILLQPTSPFRTSSEITDSLKLLSETNTPSVFAVAPVWHHPFDIIEMSGNAQWNILVERPKHIKRRQDFERDYFFITGSIYALKTDVFMKTKEFVSQDSLPMVTDAVNCVDIDYPRDLVIAEALMSQKIFQAQ